MEDIGPYRPFISNGKFSALWGQHFASKVETGFPSQASCTWDQKEGRVLVAPEMPSQVLHLPPSFKVHIIKHLAVLIIPP